MIEQIMYLAIGFLLAMLCGLMVMPLVHNRAVRLTTKRLEAATPLSIAEIQADKDQLRAEFAMSARRLEMSVDQLKSKTTSQLAELGKKSDAINRLKIELGEKNAAIFALEAREKAMKDQLRATEEEFSAKTQSLRSAEQALLDKQHELEKTTGALHERSTQAESRDAQVALLTAELETLRARVGEAERDVDSAQKRLDEQRGQSETAGRELTDARRVQETLSQRTAELERQLLVQAKEAEMLGSRIGDLENRLATQGKLLAEREYENNLLRQEVETAKRTEADLRQELVGSSKAAVTEKLRSEKTELEEQLRIAREDRAKAQRELAAIQTQTENAWATERMENALLRERINDIAAEVAKLAATIEGPNSPIDAILAAEAVADGTNGASSGPIVLPQGGTLADRIRALQSHASRSRQIS